MSATPSPRAPEGSRSPLRVREHVKAFRSQVSSPFRGKSPSTPSASPQDSPASSPMPSGFRSPLQGRSWLQSPEAKGTEGHRRTLQSEKFVCGHLDKGSAGTLVKISSKRWQTRWFYLDADRARLCYVHDAPSSCMSCLELQELSKTLKPQGFIKLDAPHTRLDTSTQTPLAFQIHFDLNLARLNARLGAKAITLRAYDEADYITWTTAIAKVVEGCAGNAEPPSPATKASDTPEPPARSPAPTTEKRESTRPKPAESRQQEDMTMPLLVCNGLGAVACAVVSSWGTLLVVALALLMGNYFLMSSGPQSIPVAGVTVRREAMVADVSDDEDGAKGSPGHPGGKKPRHTRAGLTVKQATGDEPNTWQPLDGSVYNVRIGPNYAANKKKAPSRGHLLDVVAMDVFRTSARVYNIAENLQMPELPYPVAHWFVLHFQVPDFPAPNPIWGPKDPDGPGFSIVAYLPITPETWAQCSAATSGAHALLWRFLHADREDCPNEVYDRSSLSARRTSPPPVAPGSRAAIADA